MNIRLIRRVIKHISAEPRRFMITDFYAKRAYDGQLVYDSASQIGGFEFARCGTAACIGGWAVLLRNPRKKFDELFDFHTAGKNLLGLTEYQASRLFYVSRWPIRFQVEYRAANTHKARVAVAVARIRHFIETNGTE